MTGTALIRFGRIFDAHDEIPDDDEDRFLYGRGAFIANPDGVKLLVDHDPGRELGRVQDIFPMDDITGGRRASWHAARVWGELPAWVRPGTKVSVGFLTLPKARIRSGSVELVRAAVVNEISILSHAKQPADPFAEVIRVVRGAPEISPREQVAAERERRRAEDEVAMRAWQEDAAKRGYLCRPAIGQVIGIR